MSEKPLHVRVAEAIGLTVQDESVYGCRQMCVRSVSDSGDFPMPGHRPHDHILWTYYRKCEWEEDGDWEPVVSYDTDWSATGPLIEEFGFNLEAGNGWTALDWGGEYAAVGSTPLEAVCHLIIALSEAGKLQSEPKGKEQ